MSVMNEPTTQVRIEQPAYDILRRTAIEERRSLTKQLSVIVEEWLRCQANGAREGGKANT